VYEENVMSEQDNKWLGATIPRAAPIQKPKPGEGKPVIVEPEPEPTPEPESQPEQKPAPQKSATVSPPAHKPASEIRRRTSKYRNVIDDNYKLMKPSINSPYAVLPVSWYLLYTILFSIPLLGFIIAVVWAAGGTKYQNKRNLAIAFVFYHFMLIIAASIAFLVLYTVAENRLDLLLMNIKTLIDSFMEAIKSLFI
jgi:hypothetical protein